jgi:hypothetical protein
MTKAQAAVLLHIIKTAYPSFGGTVPSEDIASLWTEMLSDVELEVASAAVKRYIATSRFPPTVADIRAIITEITTPTITPGDIWQEAYRLLNSDISPEDPDGAYANMSDVCREAVLSAGGWHALSMSEENDPHIRRVFMKAAQSRLDRDRQLGIPFDRLKIPELIPCNPLPIGGEPHG